jgi:hypothetical protein
MMTQEIMSKTIPGMDGPIGDMMKKQEKMYKDFLMRMITRSNLQNSVLQRKRKRK